MKSTTTILSALIAVATANPVDLEQRQSCPGVYVFGARETTAPAGFGTSAGLVNMVTAAYPDSQSSAIDYPACGGQAQCGGVDYDSSANQGTTAVISAVTELNSRCPDTKIVLIGYSQVRYPREAWMETYEVRGEGTRILRYCLISRVAR